MGGLSKINPWERRIGLAVIGLLSVGLVGAIAVRLRRSFRPAPVPIGAAVEPVGTKPPAPARSTRTIPPTAVLEARVGKPDPIESVVAGERPSWAARGASDLVERAEEGTADNFMPKAVAGDAAHGERQPAGSSTAEAHEPDAAEPPEAVIVEPPDDREPQPDDATAVAEAPRSDRYAELPRERSSAPSDLQQDAQGKRPSPPSGPDDVPAEPPAEPRYAAPAAQPLAGTGPSAVEHQRAEGADAAGGSAGHAAIGADRPHDPAPASGGAPLATTARPEADQGEAADPSPRAGGQPLPPPRPAARDLPDTSTSLPWSDRPPSRTAAARQYRVRPGESMWTIARDQYGSSAYYRALWAHNRDRHPDVRDIRAGDLVSIPPLEQLQALYPQLCPSPQAAGKGSRPEASRAPTPRRWYLVEEGDTLYEIARFELGQEARWTEIVELNRKRLGDDFATLRPGTRLLLPASTPPHPVAARPGRDLQQR